jgi:Spy/CpxP family protein refolding chaperone
MKTQSPIRCFASNILGCLATVLLLNSGRLAQAQPNPDAPAHPRPLIGEPRRGDLPQLGLQPGPGLVERVLNQEQRESMRDVLASQRAATRGILEKMRVARRELLKASLAESFDEDAVQAKAMAVAKLEADLAVLRAKALSQIQPPLSDEQIEKVLNPPPTDRMPPGMNRPRPGARPGNLPPHGPGDDNGRPRPPQPGNP